MPSFKAKRTKALDRARAVLMSGTVLMKSMVGLAEGEILGRSLINSHHVVVPQNVGCLRAYCMMFSNATQKRSKVGSDSIMGVSGEASAKRSVTDLDMSACRAACMVLTVGRAPGGGG